MALLAWVGRGSGREGALAGAFRPARGHTAPAGPCRLPALPGATVAARAPPRCFAHAHASPPRGGAAQARGCIIVSSSPEILCRVDRQRVVTNRPLAGTRRRGHSPEEDVALEKELLADAKECAEHVMLVDLGRNDVGKVRAEGGREEERARLRLGLAATREKRARKHPRSDC